MPIAPDTKICTKCGRVLPATTEFFYRDREWLRNTCKQCFGAAVSARQKTSDRFAEYQIEYARANAERKNAASKAWREANPEYVVAANRAWREAMRQDPEKEREAKRAYRAANLEKVRILGRQGANVRRARKAGCIVTKADYRDILEEFGMTCHICGDPIPTMRDLHFDHVVPLARGGQHNRANIRPSHASCNQRKGARIEEQTCQQ